MANVTTDAWQTSVLVPPIPITSQHIDATDQLSNFDPLSQDDTTTHHVTRDDTQQHAGQHVLYSPNVTDACLDHGNEQEEEEEQTHEHYHAHDHEIEATIADSDTISFPEPRLSLDGISESYQNVNSYMPKPPAQVNVVPPVSFIYTVANAVTNVVDALAKEDEDADSHIEQVPSHHVYAAGTHAGLSEQKRLVSMREQDKEYKDHETEAQEDDKESETIDEQKDTEFTIAAIEPPEQSEDFDAHAPEPVDRAEEERLIREEEEQFNKNLSKLTRRNVVARTFVESKRVLSNTMSRVLSITSLRKDGAKSGIHETGEKKKYVTLDRQDDIPAEVWPEDKPLRSGVGHHNTGNSQEWVIDYRALTVKTIKILCHVWTIRILAAMIICCAVCMTWLTVRLHVEHPVVIHVPEPTCARYSTSDRMDNLHEQIGHDIELYLEQHPQELCATALEIGYNKRHLVIRTHAKHAHQGGSGEGEQAKDNDAAITMTSRYLHLVHFDISHLHANQLDDSRVIHFSQNETATHCTKDENQSLVKHTRRRCPVDVTYDSWPDFQATSTKASNNLTAICVQHYIDVCNDLWPCTGA